MKKFIYIIIFSLVLTGCGSANFGGDLLMEWEKPGNEYLILKATKDKHLFIEEVDNITCINPLDISTCVNNGKVKKYLYVSDKKIEKTKKEIDGIMVDEYKRTKNAIIYKKPALFGGSEIAPQEYVGVFYTGSPFYQDGEDWYQTETATTTIEAYEEQTATTTTELILSWFGKKALGASGDPIYTGAGDGLVTNYNHTPWSTAHSDTIGNYVGYTRTTFSDGAAMGTIGGGRHPSGNYSLSRAFAPLNTSEIGSGDTITSAKFYMWIVSSSWYSAEQIGLTQTTQPDNTQLTTAEFDLCGDINAPAEGATRWESGDITTAVGGYKYFTLNATGEGWIKKDGEAPTCGSTNGWTCLGIRVAVDYSNTDPSWSTTQTWRYFSANTSEYAGTDHDPYLEVVYSGGGGSTPASQESDWIIFN